MAEPARPRCRLYLITPPRFEPAAFADVLAGALDGGDVACVQLRLPQAEDDAIRRAAEALISPCRTRGVAFLIDNHMEIAAEVDADGVHLSDERGVDAARRRLGADRIVGVACGGSRHRAMTAGQADADYVSFGACFPSPTLPDAEVVADDSLAWWSELMEIPCVAVGGITPANCAPLVAAGADFLAVSSAVWTDPRGPAAAIAAFNDVFERQR